LKLVEKGYTREEAYKEVQKIALKCWENKSSFKDEVKNYFKFSQEEIDEIFSPEYYLRNIDVIYERFK
jgi:adenylosuccinate lyase